MSGPAAGLKRGSGVGVWLFDLRRLQGPLLAAEAIHPRLSAEDIARANAMRDESARGAWRAARVGLRLALEAWSGKSLEGRAFSIAPGGRPFLPAPWPSFSLSHSGPLVLAAISEAGAAGADIEAVAPRKIVGERRQEIESLAVALADGTSLPPGNAEHRFIQAWCRLEAFAKADGRGIGRLLTQAGITGRRRGPRGAASPQSNTAPIEDGAAPGMAASVQPLAAHQIFDLQLQDLAPGYVAAVAIFAAGGLSAPAVTAGDALLSELRPVR